MYMYFINYSAAMLTLIQSNSLTLTSAKIALSKYRRYWFSRWRRCQRPDGCLQDSNYITPESTLKLTLHVSYFARSDIKTNYRPCQAALLTCTPTEKYWREGVKNWPSSHFEAHHRFDAASTSIPIIRIIGGLCYWRYWWQFEPRTLVAEATCYARQHYPKAGQPAGGAVMASSIPLWSLMTAETLQNIPASAMR